MSRAAGPGPHRRPRRQCWGGQHAAAGPAALRRVNRHGLAQMPPLQSWSQAPSTAAPFRCWCEPCGEPGHIGLDRNERTGGARRRPRQLPPLADPAACAGKAPRSFVGRPPKRPHHPRVWTGERKHRRCRSHGPVVPVDHAAFGPRVPRVCGRRVELPAALSCEELGPAKRFCGRLRTPPSARLSPGLANYCGRVLFVCLFSLFYFCLFLVFPLLFFLHPVVPSPHQQAFRCPP